jgi:hypothetical protein
VVDQILFYISAAQDLMAEREILARLTTEIPVTLGWKIAQTPVKGEPFDRQSVLNADFHMILLGSDIRAPIGVEWMIARSAQKKPVLFTKSGILRTDAAKDFQRTLEDYVPWNSYKELKELRIKTLKLLGDHILEEAIYYALRPEEYDGLLKWRKDLDGEKVEEVEEIHGGVHEGGIIFSRERYIPSEGVLLEPGGRSKTSSQESEKPT